MRGLMQDRQLTIPSLLTRVERNFAHKRIITGGSAEAIATWADLAPRVRKLAHALDVGLEHLAGARQIG